MVETQFKENTRKGIAMRHKSQVILLLRMHLLCYKRSAAGLTWKVLKMPLIYFGGHGFYYYTCSNSVPRKLLSCLKELSVRLTPWDNGHSWVEFRRSAQLSGRNEVKQNSRCYIWALRTVKQPCKSMWLWDYCASPSSQILFLVPGKRNSLQFYSK